MIRTTPRVIGRSRNPAAGLATGTIFKRAPERSVDEDKPAEGEEPAEPGLHAEHQTEERTRRREG
jgi:hypothetical protein